ncbi:GNAT family N-acetyltransferase [Streptomyces sp. NPDC008125]|uniref:GNAT family N-acetyltransferase n=1 Tax=Streptomyces sp. NPDC008125 TaxID=3364811 RepID=UPI0036E5B0F8
MKISVDDLSGRDIAEFLQAHVDEMRAITPLESKHALDLDGLRVPDVTFWTAYDGDTLIGCGAVKRIEEGHAEIKSMRTEPTRKRTGVASQLLAHIITEARGMGYRRLSLETGATDSFAPARALYEKFEFTYCGPFANYREDPNSAFMTRLL